jgi:hypothetical protein
MKCSQGHENPPHYRFCVLCGEPLPGPSASPGPGTGSPLGPAPRIEAAPSVPAPWTPAAARPVPTVWPPMGVTVIVFYFILQAIGYAIANIAIGIAAAVGAGIASAFSERLLEALRSDWGVQAGLFLLGLLGTLLYFLSLFSAATAVGLWKRRKWGRQWAIPLVWINAGFVLVAVILAFTPSAVLSGLVSVGLALWITVYLNQLAAAFEE